jgi:hypothetical protein
MRDVPAGLKWPCNPAIPSTWPMRNHNGNAGLPPVQGMGDPQLTPSADVQIEDAQIEEVPGDEPQQECQPADD